MKWVYEGLGLAVYRNGLFYSNFGQIFYMANYLDGNELRMALVSYNKYKDEKSRLYLWDAFWQIASRMVHVRLKHMPERWFDAEDVANYVAATVMDKAAQGKIVFKKDKGSAFNYACGIVQKQILTLCGTLRTEQKHRQFEQESNDEYGHDDHGRLGEPVSSNNPTLDDVIAREEEEIYGNVGDFVAAAIGSGGYTNRVILGKNVKIDVEDEHYLDEYAWHLMGPLNNYLHHNKLGYLHRLIKKPPEGKYIVFLGGGYFDLRKRNLMVSDKPMQHKTGNSAKIETMRGVLKICQMTLNGVDAKKTISFHVTIRHNKKRVVIKDIPKAKLAGQCYDYVIWNLCHLKEYLNHPSIDYDGWTCEDSIMKKLKKAIEKLK